MQGLGIVLLYLLQGLGACFVGILFQGHGTLIRCDHLVALLQGTQERCQHCKHLSYNISAWGVGVDGSRCGCNGHGWCSWPWSGWNRWGAVIHYDAATGFGGRTSGISTRSGAQGKEREEGQGCQKEIDEKIADGIEMRFRQVCQEADEELANGSKVQFLKEQRSGETAKGQQERTPTAEGEICFGNELKEKQVGQKESHFKEQGEKPQDSQGRACSGCGSLAATGRVLPAARSLEDLPAAAGGRHVSAHGRGAGMERWYASLLLWVSGGGFCCWLPTNTGRVWPWATEASASWRHGGSTSVCQLVSTGRAGEDYGRHPEAHPGPQLSERRPAER